MSAWFASERWIFVHHHGQKWLGEVISETTNRLTNTRVARASRISMQWCNVRIAAARRHITSWIVRPEQGDLLPIVEPSLPRPRTRTPPRSPVYHQEPAVFLPNPEAALPDCSFITENLASSAEARSDEATETRHSDARQRFVNVVRTVIMFQSTNRPMSPTQKLFVRYSNSFHISSHDDVARSIPGSWDVITRSGCDQRN